MISPITLTQQFRNSLRNQTPLWSRILLDKLLVRHLDEKILTLIQPNFHRLFNDSHLTVRIQSHFNPVHVLIAVYLRHI